MAGEERFGVVEVQGQKGEMGVGDSQGQHWWWRAGKLASTQKRILDSQYGNRKYSCTLIFRIGIVLEK